MKEENATRFCSACGSKIYLEDQFCPMCGKKVERNSGAINNDENVTHTEDESVESNMQNSESVQDNGNSKEVESDENQASVKGSSNAKELSIEDKILLQKINIMEKNIGKRRDETELKSQKRDENDWWKSWLCANCGRTNLINQQKCLACGLDIRSSYTLGRKNGTISAEEEQFYYERIRPHQMQNEILKKQKEQMEYEDKKRQQEAMSFTPKEKVSGFAITSMILGIMTLIVAFDNMVYFEYKNCAIAGIAAIVFSMSPIKNKKKGYGMAITGLICAIIAIIRIFILWNQAVDNHNVEINNTENTGLETIEINNNNIKMDESIVECTIYQNYDENNKNVKEPQKAQINGMIFEKGMSYEAAIEIAKKNKCTFNNNADKILTAHDMITMTFKINGVSAFMLSFSTKDKESAKLKDCILKEVTLKEDYNCDWYNMYGFGAKGKNIPDYFSFIEQLEKHNVSYSDYTDENGNLRVHIGKHLHDGIYQRNDFYFDKSSGKCLYTSWDEGKDLLDP